MDKCPVCGTALLKPVVQAGNRDASKFSCPRCGQFVLSRTLIACLPNILSRHSDAPAKLSHALRRAQEQNSEPEFTTHTIDAVLEVPLPRPKEQADLLIRWLAENTPGPGETVWIESRTHAGIVGAKTPGGFGLIVDHLFQSGLVKGVQSNTLDESGRAHAMLSLSGWEYYERLRQGSVAYRKAFMAMKFGDPTLNQILTDVFRPSAKRAGFELVKLDDAPRAGLIDDRLRVEIQSSDFVIADLTHDNLGAYWEAGYAEGLGKPVIYTCEKQKFDTAKTHFDTNHHLTIVWDIGNQSEAGNSLVATIRATLPHLAKQSDDAT